MVSNTIIPYHDGVYEGSITNGVPNGWGKLTYLHDVVYEGEWRNGQEHDKGTITWWNGCSFTGSFEEGKPISTCKHFLTHMYELGQRQQQLADMKHDLEELLELLELQKETTQQVQLTLDMWQSRFDMLFQVAKDAGADASLLVGIRDGHGAFV